MIYMLTIIIFLITKIPMVTKNHEKTTILPLGFFFKDVVIVKCHYIYKKCH